MITASFERSLFPEPPLPAGTSFQSKADSALTLEERRQKDLQAVHDRWKQRVAAGEKRASDLNARFAKWYYVISAESFENLRLKRSDLLRDKPKQS